MVRHISAPLASWSAFIQVSIKVYCFCMVLTYCLLYLQAVNNVPRGIKPRMEAIEVKCNSELFSSPNTNRRSDVSFTELIINNSLSNLLDESWFSTDNGVYDGFDEADRSVKL